MLEPNDKLSIIDLYRAYNKSIDESDPSAWADTFTADGVFAHPVREYRGRAELESFVKERSEKLPAHPVMEQQHWNDEIRLEGGSGEATGGCAVLVVGVDRATGKLAIVVHGLYQDELVKVNSSWRFRSRALRVL
ncbi:nuclear transport factor 2 family protein [Paraburkholderia panacisoli]|uniref:Nuclear transport factor 2 family protein n=1 Tax=Paraburkholderia panacisoli TaxID=2603818 RepID=A0A5B0G8T5_9BURK|nr:nuclear transport factor 2 family protein [Paraburkholderia panacisoli]KAA0999145.1 nuclear transport factor 2 family protein [Paraburkholderia panacisoli]